MLTIRQAQIDAMIKGTDEEFETFLMNHAREEFPEKTENIEDEKLRLMVRSGIKRAESHGFTTVADVTAFLSIMFSVAPNFDEQPKISEVLDDTRFSTRDRLELLWSPSVTEEHWKEAADNSNDESWTVENF